MGCRNWDGLTPIGVARLSGQKDVAKFLEEHVAPSSMAQDMTQELAKLENTVDEKTQRLRERKIRRLKRKARTGRQARGPLSHGNVVARVLETLYGVI